MRGIGDQVKHDEEKQAMPTKLRALPTFWTGTGPVTTSSLTQRALFVGQVILFGVVVVQFIMLYKSFALAAACGGVVDAGMLRRQSASSSTSSLPDYYQTVPELYVQRKH